ATGGARLGGTGVAANEGDAFGGWLATSDLPNQPPSLSPAREPMAPPSKPPIAIPMGPPNAPTAAPSLAPAKPPASVPAAPPYPRAFSSRVVAFLAVSKT